MKCKTEDYLFGTRRHPLIHSSLILPLCSPIPVRRVQNTSSSFAKRTSSATRRVYTSPWKKKKKTHRSYPPPHVVDFHIAFKSKPGLIELRRQDKTVDEVEAATASQRARLLLEGTPPSRTHPRADRARARRAERLHPTPAPSREPRKYGRVFLRSPACLIFHFCFSGSGRARGAERQRNVPALCRPAGDVRASHPGGRGAPSRRTQGKPLLKKKDDPVPTSPDPGLEHHLVSQRRRR